MPRADFYLIDKPRFREQPLLLVCELAKRAYAAQKPTLVLTRDFEQAEAVDSLLWDFDEDSYIPHQLAGDDDDMHTAVLIVPPGVDTDDRPMVINLRDTCAPGRYERVLEGRTYLGELRGASKKKESIFDIFKVIGALKQRFGQVAVNFGEPIKLAA